MGTPLFPGDAFQWAHFCNDGGFLGMLASIGVPLALDLVRKISGKGMQTQPPPPPRTKRSPGIPKGKGMQIQPPPFYGTWEDYYRLKKT